MPRRSSRLRREMAGIGLFFPPVPTHAVCHRLEVLYSFLLMHIRSTRSSPMARFSQGWLVQIYSKVTPNAARFLRTFTAPPISTALAWRPEAAVVSKRRYSTSDLLNGLVEGWLRLRTAPCFCLDMFSRTCSKWMHSQIRLVPLDCWDK